MSENLNFDLFRSLLFWNLGNLRHFGIWVRFYFGAAVRDVDDAGEDEGKGVSKS